MQEVGHDHHLDAAELCNEWVAYSAQNDDCDLNTENIDKFENLLHVKSRQTPTSRRAVSRTKAGTRGDGVRIYTKEDLGEL